MTQTIFASALFLAVAAPASAQFVHDELVDGDLSDDASAPTPLAFVTGTNTVTGTVEESAGPDGDRDFWTFTVGGSQTLENVFLRVYSPDNVGFAAINEGSTSFVPDPATSGEFLAGVLIDGSDVGADLMELFVSESVTTFALSVPELGPGDYSFVIQQTSPLVQEYSLEFVLVEDPVPVEAVRWSDLKTALDD